MRLRDHCLPIALALTLVGCDGTRHVDTSGVELAFEMVTGTNRALVDTALADTRSGRLHEAVVAFREIEQRYRLNPRQELAVKAILRDLERRQPSPALPPPPPATNTPATPAAP
jgi:hypothetical protein